MKKQKWDVSSVLKNWRGIKLFICCLICCTGIPVFCDTMYIYTYEICNDEPVPPGLQVKEGILDGLFESGHIVFDDCSDPGSENLLSQTHLKKLILDAKKGGAYYLVGVQVTTRTRSRHNEHEFIESSAVFYLYDVESGKLMHQGKTTMTNKEREAVMDREALWFGLGVYISGEINHYYYNREKKSG